MQASHSSKNLLPKTEKNTSVSNQGLNDDTHLCYRGSIFSDPLNKKNLSYMTDRVPGYSIYSLENLN